MKTYISYDVNIVINLWGGGMLHLFKKKETATLV